MSKQHSNEVCECFIGCEWSLIPVRVQACCCQAKDRPRRGVKLRHTLPATHSTYRRIQRCPAGGLIAAALAGISLPSSRQSPSCDCLPLRFATPVDVYRGGTALNLPGLNPSCWAKYDCEVSKKGKMFGHSCSCVCFFVFFFGWFNFTGPQAIIKANQCEQSEGLWWGCSLAFSVRIWCCRINAWASERCGSVLKADDHTDTQTALALTDAAPDTINQTSANIYWLVCQLVEKNVRPASLLRRSENKQEHGRVIYLTSVCGEREKND